MLIVGEAFMLFEGFEGFEGSKSSDFFILKSIPWIKKLKKLIKEQNNKPNQEYHHMIAVKESSVQFVGVLLINIA